MEIENSFMGKYAGKIIVRNEYLPERCEICHQRDLFNPRNGSCSRCSNIRIPIINEENYEEPNRFRVEVSNQNVDVFKTCAILVFLINLTSEVFLLNAFCFLFLIEILVILGLSIINSLGLDIEADVLKGTACGLGFSIIAGFILCFLLAIKTSLFFTHL
jgi:hypothetical protein